MAGHTFTDENFQAEVIESKEPVLVDFWAPWCGPCKMLSPVVEEIAGEMEGVTIGKLNLEENPATAGKFSVMSIPTLLFFKDGKVMEQMVGIQSKGTIKAKLEELKG